MDPMRLPTRRATIHFARKLAAALAPGDLVILSGGLGAGKTFLTRALCRALGVPPSTPITSPTFTLVHEHHGDEQHGSLRVAHADLYRLRGAGELVELGLRDLRADGAVLVVEWGEPFVAELGGDALVVTIRTSPQGTRELDLAATGPRGQDLVERLAVRLEGATQPPP
jgi:tRNA threonylcarbamoyladenosine biosynthesis protein TsaE